MAFFIYILRSESKGGKFYTGMTDDVDKRLNEHNRGKSKFTSGYIPWVVVHKEQFTTREEARAREKYFKTGAGRRFIKKLTSTH